MRIESDVKLDFKDVLIRPKRSTLKSRSEVDLHRTYHFRNSGKTWTGVPIAVANMDSTGTFEMAEAVGPKHGLLTCIHKHYTVEEWSDFVSRNSENGNGNGNGGGGAGGDDEGGALRHVAVSCGSSDADRVKLGRILDAAGATAAGVDKICLDVANGYSESFVDCIRRVREAHPGHTIFAGNVVTCEMTEELILSGADVVKVGIGPGSVCTTRRQTGVGYPQLSAIIECADAAHGLGGLVMGDGGCTCPGDFAKAFGAGADFVMAGGMFAGHDESGGDVVQDPNDTTKKRKLFYGMSSCTAMKKHSGGVADYRSSEGKTVSVPYRGPVEGTVLDVLGGVRSTCTYVGASSIKELSKRTTFVRVTQQLNQMFGKDEKKT